MHMDHIHFHAEPKYLLLAMTAGIESSDHERVGPGLESKGSVVQSEAVAVVVWCRRDETTDGLSGSEGTAGTCRQNSSRRLLCQTVRVCRDNRETLLLLFCDLCCSNIPKVLVWNCWIIPLYPVILTGHFIQSSTVPPRNPCHGIEGAAACFSTLDSSPVTTFLPCVPISLTLFHVLVPV